MQLKSLTARGLAAKLGGEHEAAKAIGIARGGGRVRQSKGLGQPMGAGIDREGKAFGQPMGAGIDREGKAFVQPRGAWSAKVAGIDREDKACRAFSPQYFQECFHLSITEESYSPSVFINQSVMLYPFIFSGMVYETYTA